MPYTLFSQGKIGRELMPFKQLMTAKSLPGKGLLSTVYNILMNKESKPPLAYQNAWHVELGITIPKPSWDSLWTTSLNSSRNINISMLTYKITFRWQLPPHKSHNSISNRCWKSCGSRGTFIHCFWTCPRLLGPSYYPNWKHSGNLDT